MRTETRWRRTLEAIAFLGLVSLPAAADPGHASAIARRPFYAAGDAAPVTNNPLVATPKVNEIDTEPNFAWGLSPDKDPYLRSTGLASTIDAADFTAVMAQASRVFASLDLAFAAKCLAAANSAWTWVQANPDIGETDIYYADPDPSQEVLWALAEMVRVTHDPTLTQT